MLRMYKAQTRRGGYNPHGVSPLSIGDTFYFQDCARPLSGMPIFAPAIRRNPWIVIAFLNREYHNYGGNSFMTGGDCAIVRSLRDGRTKIVASWFLNWHRDHDFQTMEGKQLPIPICPGYEFIPAPPKPVKQSRRKRIAA